MVVASEEDGGVGEWLGLSLRSAARERRGLAVAMGRLWRCGFESSPLPEEVSVSVRLLPVLVVGELASGLRDIGGGGALVFEGDFC